MSDLVEYARKEHDLWKAAFSEAGVPARPRKGGPPPATAPRGAEERIDRVLTAEERARSRILSLSYAIAAEQVAEVQQFRDSYLGDGESRREMAEAFLSSAAYRFFSAKRLAKVGVSTKALRSREIVLRGRGKRYWTVQLADGWPQLVIRYRIECLHGGKWTEMDLVLPELSDAGHDPWKKLSVGPPDLEAAERKYLRGSVFDELARLSSYFASTFWWTGQAACWFVLTGEEPPSPAITMSRDLRGVRGRMKARVVLEVQPWVSESSVSRAYKTVQDDLLGKNARPITVASLDRFEFAQARGAFKSARPGWPQLFADWRAKLTRARRRTGPTTWRKFRDLCLRTRDELLRPIYANGRPLAIARKEAQFMEAVRKGRDPEQVRLLATELHRPRSGRSAT